MSGIFAESGKRVSKGPASVLPKGIGLWKWPSEQRLEAGRNQRPGLGGRGGVLKLESCLVLALDAWGRVKDNLKGWPAALSDFWGPPWNGSSCGGRVGSGKAGERKSSFLCKWFARLKKTVMTVQNSLQKGRREEVKRGEKRRGEGGVMSV